MVNISTSRTWLWLVVLVALTLGGCQSSDEFATASGTVTVEGKPVSGVIIRLVPIAPTTGPKSATTVYNGAFSFDAEERLHGGEYRVRFSVMPANLRAQLPPEQFEGIVPADKSIAFEYDSKSEITWTITPGAENTSTFDIELR